MKKHEELAWNILTSQEQNSLFLTLSNGLSSWEAGEILKIAHYKYLELKERAEKFFKMFSNYFEIHKSLFSPDSVTDLRFRDYIEASIQRRLTKKEAITITGDSSLKLTDISSQLILKNMDRLLNSELQHDIEVYKLIMEFDRWNNWRILPRKIQQPSAYKRRNNKRDKIYINYINKIPEHKVKAIMAIYSYNPTKKSKKAYYIGLISPTLFEDGYHILSIKTTDEVVEKLTKLSIYIFNTKDNAEVFSYMVSRYSGNNKPSQGQKFWPEYRSSIQRAINYNKINNINFYVDKLDMAYEINPRKPKKDKKHGASRLNLENND